MKKTLFVVAIAAVLVFAFAASAMAASGFPNRSSAYLGSLNTSTQTDQIALAAGGTKAAYITWTQAKTSVAAMEEFNGTGVSGTEAATQLLMDKGPHSGYSMTTIKCQVCHSAHKAVYTGTALTPSSTGGCVTCHGAASTFGFETVAAGDALDSRHGGAEACTSYLCHTQSPHGADVSVYPAAASALLSAYVDPQLKAAITSGQTDAIVKAGGVNAEGAAWTARKHFGGESYVGVDIYQPDFDLTAEAALMNPATADAKALGRAVATGYTCANEGCHVNGSFNGMSSRSWYGEWEFYAADGSLIVTAGTNYNFNGGNDPFNMNLGRRQPVKGHALFSTLTTTTENPLGTAWATSGLCVDCHDQVDTRLTEYSFPHSQSIWVAGVNPNPAPLAAAVARNVVNTVIDGQSYYRTGNTAAWFTLAANTGATAVNTTTRQVATTTSTFEPLTVAMDGACLKCHAQGDTALGSIGTTF